MSEKLNIKIECKDCGKYIVLNFFSGVYYGNCKDCGYHISVMFIKKMKKLKEESKEQDVQ